MENSKNPSVASFNVQYERLLQLCREKEQINQQLLETVRKQQGQIEQLLIAAELKQQHKIKKIPYSTLKGNLINNKYILLNIKDEQDGIFLPENVRLCDLQQLRQPSNKKIQYPKQNGQYIKQNQSSKAAFQQLENLKSKVVQIMKPEQKQQNEKSKIQVSSEAQFFKLDNYADDKNNKVKQKPKTIYKRK